MIAIMHVPTRGICEELEIPLDITVLELIQAINTIYSLGVKPDNIYNYCLKADNPKALLRGEKTLREYGLRDGTELWTWNE